MKENRIIRKIRALLAKAEESNNPEEAMIAARQARFLMDKYQIDEFEARGDGKAKHKFASEKAKEWYHGKSLKRPIEIIVQECAKLNDVQVYNTRRGKEVTYLFQGLENDVEMAHLITQYVLDILYTKIKYMPPVGAVAKNNYRLGFALGIREQVTNILEERKRKVLSNGGKGLMVVKKNIVEAKFGSQGWGKVRTSKQIYDPSSLEKGRQDGRNTKLNERVE